ncbi:hypothetical protein C8R43DRAFT_1175227 [Mycena crocata]|nr:hypothetical protein C8R43DRAFT_1175227 [Mycena crocata]
MFINVHSLDGRVAAANNGVYHGSKDRWRKASGKSHQSVAVLVPFYDLTVIHHAFRLAPSVSQNQTMLAPSHLRLRLAEIDNEVEIRELKLRLLAAEQEKITDDLDCFYSGLTLPAEITGEIFSPTSLAFTRWNPSSGNPYSEPSHLSNQIPRRLVENISHDISVLIETPNLVVLTASASVYGDYTIPQGLQHNPLPHLHILSRAEATQSCRPPFRMVCVHTSIADMLATRARGHRDGVAKLESLHLKLVHVGRSRASVDEIRACLRPFIAEGLEATIGAS